MEQSNIRGRPIKNNESLNIYEIAELNEHNKSLLLQHKLISLYENYISHAKSYIPIPTYMTTLYMENCNKLYPNNNDLINKISNNDNSIIQSVKLLILNCRNNDLLNDLIKFFESSKSI